MLRPEDCWSHQVWLLFSPWSDFQCGPMRDVIFTLTLGLAVITFPRSFTLELDSSRYSVSSKTGFRSKLDPVASSRKSPWGRWSPWVGRAGGDRSLHSPAFAFQGSTTARWEAVSTSSEGYSISAPVASQSTSPSIKHAAARPDLTPARRSHGFQGHLLPSPLPSREKRHFVTWVTRQPLLPSREPKILASQSDSIFVCTHYTPPRCRNLHRFKQTLFLYSFNQFLL